MMAAMTSFYADWCCYLVNAHAVYARLYAAASTVLDLQYICTFFGVLCVFFYNYLQFTSWLTGNTFVLVNRSDSCQAWLVCVGEPSWHITSYPGQLSLAIRLWPGAIYSSEGWELSRHISSIYLASWVGAIAQWLACSTSDRQIVGSGLAGLGCRVATVGQLLFAPWAWAYSTLHP